MSTDIVEATGDHGLRLAIIRDGETVIDFTLGESDTLAFAAGVSRVLQTIGEIVATERCPQCGQTGIDRIEAPKSRLEHCSGCGGVLDIAITDEVIRAGLDQLRNARRVLRSVGTDPMLSARGHLATLDVGKAMLRCALRALRNSGVEIDTPVGLL